MGLALHSYLGHTSSSTIAYFRYSYAPRHYNRNSQIETRTYIIHNSKHVTILGAMRTPSLLSLVTRQPAAKNSNISY